MDNEFRSLMHRVHGGSEEAARELVQKYGDAIRRAVRRALHRALRPRFDSLDFVQNVWKSFFRERDKLDRFEKPQELAAFLISVARNKIRIESRRQTADKCDARREEDFGGTHESDVDHLLDQGPAPTEVVMARDEWDRVLQGQPAVYRRIVELRLQGYTYQEIGEDLHLHKGIVLRILQRLLRRIPK
jgi:RNA polymerase sigma-70 factor (ECF subfamily)